MSCCTTHEVDEILKQERFSSLAYCLWISQTSSSNFLQFDHGPRKWGAGGSWPPWILKLLAKKRLFFQFRGVLKNKFYHFCPPPGKNPSDAHDFDTCNRERRALWALQTFIPSVTAAKEAKGGAGGLSWHMVFWLYSKMEVSGCSYETDRGSRNDMQFGIPLELRLTKVLFSKAVLIVKVTSFNRRWRPRKNRGQKRKTQKYCLMFGILDDVYSLDL